MSFPPKWQKIVIFVEKCHTFLPGKMPNMDLNLIKLPKMLSCIDFIILELQDTTSHANQKNFISFSKIVLSNFAEIELNFVIFDISKSSKGPHSFKNHLNWFVGLSSCKESPKK